MFVIYNRGYDECYIELFNDSDLAYKRFEEFSADKYEASILGALVLLDVSNAKEEDKQYLLEHKDVEVDKNIMDNIWNQNEELDWFDLENM